jgi:hypothetical protein
MGKLMSIVVVATSTATRAAKPASYISGHLETVDPVSGRVVPLTIGSVVISGATSATSRVDGTGRFRVAVKPGLYTVTGLVDVAHPDFFCHPGDGVSVATGASITVLVSCLGDAG